MIHNNYYRCYYNDNPSQLFRKDPYDKWDIHFNTGPILRQLRSFKEETLRSCELMYASLRKYTPKINLFFSGGMDSECMLRCFHERGIPVNPIILVHRHAETAEETVNARQVCRELSIKPTIFPIDLWTIFKSGKFHEIGVKYRTTTMGMDELLYVLEIVKEPCVLADDIQMMYISDSAGRANKVENDFKQWFYVVREDADAVYDRFEAVTGIPIIADSFRYTPESWAAMLLTDFVKHAVTKRKIPSLYTVKNHMMSKEFNVKFREKTGVLGMTQHWPMFRQLEKDLTHFVYPEKEILIPYNELLSKLGVTDAV